MTRLIPAPRKTTMADARVTVAPRYTAEAVFADAAATLAEYARRTHGVTLTKGEGGITFTFDQELPAPHTHSATKTEQVDATATTDGVKAYNPGDTVEYAGRNLNLTVYIK